MSRPGPPEVARGTFPSLRVRRSEPLCPPGRISSTSGPRELAERTGHVRARGESCSLYPAGQGAPVCDAWEAASDGEVTAAALADGCGWGERKREAARRACAGFVGAAGEGQAGARDVRELASLLGRGLTAAHGEVVRGHADVWEAGTASLCGTVVVPSGEEHWTATVVTVGNVHAFLCSPRFPPLEITAGSLALARNAADPGGRLGPYVDAGEADLRNMQRYAVECREGDWIWLVTDSVVRNCDVALVGATAPLDMLGPQLLKRCEENTRPLREFLSANPTAAAPETLAGTLDHASVLGVLVGRPALAGPYEWAGEAALGGEALEEMEWAEKEDWSRVFVCTPPYSGPVRLEVRGALLVVACAEFAGSPLVPGICRVRSLGWTHLSEQVPRKLLARWLQRILPERASSFGDAFLSLVPERDTLQVIGKGNSVALPTGVHVSEVIVQVFGRENTLLSTKRIVFASCQDASKLLEFVRTTAIPQGVTTMSSFHDWLQGLLVPASEKY